MQSSLTTMIIQSRQRYSALQNWESFQCAYSMSQNLLATSNFCCVTTSLAFSSMLMENEPEMLILHGVIYHLLLVRYDNFYFHLFLLSILQFFKFNNSFCLAFRKPYLFIVHFSSVEIIRIDTETYKTSANKPEKTLIELSNPRFLGLAGQRGIYVAAINSTLEMLKIEGVQRTSAVTGSLTSLDALYVNRFRNPYSIFQLELSKLKN